MTVFEIILVMLAAAVLLLQLARRLKLPYPVLLAIAGAAVAVAPVDVGLHLNPELALALFVAPVLLDAAYDTSLRDLKRHWGSRHRTESGFTPPLSTKDSDGAADLDAALCGPTQLPSDG